MCGGSEGIVFYENILKHNTHVHLLMVFSKNRDSWG